VTHETDIDSTGISGVYYERDFFSEFLPYLPLCSSCSLSICVSIASEKFPSNNIKYSLISYEDRLTNLPTLFLEYGYAKMGFDEVNATYKSPENIV
jgi:hypothetical protein